MVYVGHTRGIVVSVDILGKSEKEPLELDELEKALVVLIGKVRCNMPKKKFCRCFARALQTAVKKYKGSIQ